MAAGPSRPRRGATLKHSFLMDGGQLGRLIAQHDWASTSLGPIDDWPDALRTAVALMLQSPVPIVTLWGREGVMIYNDAYSRFAGERHPSLLGSNVREGWGEIASFNDNVVSHVLLGNQPLSYTKPSVSKPHAAAQAHVGVRRNPATICGSFWSRRRARLTAAFIVALGLHGGFGNACLDVVPDQLVRVEVS